MINIWKSKIKYKFLSNLYKSRLQTKVSRGEQLLLIDSYRRLVQEGRPLPSFKDIGFQEHSGTDEDGILLFLFAVLGIKNRVLVDVGCATPVGSNSANLILNHQWWGLLLDGSDVGIDATKALYAATPSVRNCPPVVKKAFVTVENINQLITDSGIDGEIDLLSIDIDGIDYWLWDAIDVVNPRVVVVEYQTALGAEESLTVPYKADFSRDDYTINSDPSEIVYAGASLAAFNKLAKKKGYSLVACNSQEFNAFFVRDDVNNNVFPEIPLEKCFEHPRSRNMVDKHLAAAKQMPWEEI